MRKNIGGPFPAAFLGYPLRVSQTAVILDIDGTLVDTNYHHAIAWYRAFRRSDVTLPLWKIHRHMGMGGDQLVESLTDADFEEEHGDEVRAAEKKLYGELIDEVSPMEKARDLIVAFKDAGALVVLASSAKEEEVDHYLDLLGVRDVVDDWTTSADVETTKPAPDLIQAALNKVSCDRSFLVGDTTWDCEAAARAGIQTIAVLTGGFSEEELREAGAVEVYRSVGELLERLPDSSLV